ncbi:AraC family transcriptional regulator [Streptomyces sp. NPDC046832]|uniref:helix-turn-helix transcriptional regulator n=1 Tax=Streptomyces sp. NPDC046832 TaxID=3155020 RepID=UPI0033E9F014
MSDTPVLRVEFETADWDVAQDFLEAAYEHAPRVRLTRERRGGSLVSVAQVAAGPVMSTDVMVAPDLSFLLEPTELVTIDVFQEGFYERYEHEMTQRYGPGDVAVVLAPGTSYRAASGDRLRAHAVTLPPDLLREQAPEAPGGPPRPLRFLDPTPARGAAADVWRSATTYVRRLLTDPGTSASPLLVANAARLLAQTALAVFPNTLLAGTAPAVRDGADATPETVRRAVAFIEANADRDIGVAQIAAAAYVTPRAVQYAFRRHLDATPLAYLRRVRLDAAHRDLLAAEPRSTTVTEIAARWGFAHPGHFSVHYRDAYRTTPSNTLNLRSGYTPPADA